MINKFEINTQAEKIRKYFEEDVSSPIDIFSLVLSLKNLTLIFLPLGKATSGICVKLDDSAIIGINSAMSLGRQRFSLAHELYHYFFDSNLHPSPSNTQIGCSDEVEQKADQFASFLLLPPLALKEMCEEYISEDKQGKLSLASIIKMEQRYGISHQAMLYRLKEDEYITEADCPALQNNVIREAARLGFNTRLYKPTPDDEQFRTYGYYINATETLDNADLISSGKFDEFLLDAFRDDIVYGLIDEEGVETLD